MVVGGTEGVGHGGVKSATHIYFFWCHLFQFVKLIQADCKLLIFVKEGSTVLFCKVLGWECVLGLHDVSVI